MSPLFQLNLDQNWFTFRSNLRISSFLRGQLRFWLSHHIPWGHHLRPEFKVEQSYTDSHSTSTSDFRMFTNRCQTLVLQVVISLILRQRQSPNHLLTLRRQSAPKGLSYKSQSGRKSRQESSPTARPCRNLGVFHCFSNLRSLQWKVPCRGNLPRRMRHYLASDMDPSEV